MAIRHKNPYEVCVVNHGDFLVFKYLASKQMRNVKANIKGEKVNWMKMKWIRTTKAELYTLFYSYGFNDDVLEAIKVTGALNRRGKPSVEDDAPVEVPPKYNEKLPVTAAKKKDLLSMCESGIVPDENHSFYRGAFCKSDRKVTCPDIEECDE